MLRVLAVIFGVILLLPGACSVFSMLAFLPSMASGHFAGAGSLILLWVVCLAVSYGGFMMIRSGGRK